MRKIIRVKNCTDPELVNHAPAAKNGYGVMFAKLDEDIIVVKVAAMVSVEIWSIWFGDHPNQMSHEKMCDKLNAQDIRYNGLKLEFEVFDEELDELNARYEYDESTQQYVRIN